MADLIYCDYCGAELKNHPFFYKVGRFVGEDSLWPDCSNEYFKGNFGKDRLQKYDSETMKKIEDLE